MDLLALNHFPCWANAFLYAAVWRCRPCNRQRTNWLAFLQRLEVFWLSHSLEGRGKCDDNLWLRTIVILTSSGLLVESEPIALRCIVDLGVRRLKLAHRFGLPRVVLGLMPSALLILLTWLWNPQARPLGVAWIRRDDASDSTSIEHCESGFPCQLRRALVAGRALIGLQGAFNFLPSFPQLLLLRLQCFRAHCHFMERQVQFLGFGRLFKLDWAILSKA